MSLKGTAQETLEILDTGRYTNLAGEVVDFLAAQQAAVAGTTLYQPDRANELFASTNTDRPETPLRIEVTDETTQIAAHRLVTSQGCDDLVLLNFASARNPGGGFTNGAKAQEEDLCRCSGLYPCLLTQPLYYDINRAQTSLLYTDNIIYSPQVPFFRTSSRDLLARPFLTGVITAPAPNAGQIRLKQECSADRVESVLKQRAGLILAIARQHQHRSLLLGAWGCGVFANDPHLVADAFGTWLASPTFTGCFDRVTFAIYDRSKERSTLAAFRSRFQT
jgi:uncharacterized protein (TIGR02452 family)